MFTRPAGDKRFPRLGINSAIRPTDFFEKLQSDTFQRHYPPRKTWYWIPWIKPLNCFLKCCLKCILYCCVYFRAVFAKNQFETAFYKSGRVDDKKWILFCVVLEDFLSSPRDLAKDASAFAQQPDGPHLLSSAEDLFNSLDEDDACDQPTAVSAPKIGVGKVQVQKTVTSKGSGRAHDEDDSDSEVEKDTQPPLSQNSVVLSGLTAPSQPAASSNAATRPQQSSSSGSSEMTPPRAAKTRNIRSSKMNA